MSKVVVINHITLDGVMQAPGRPEEDTRDGFTYGGWAAPNVDEVVMKTLGGRMGEGNRLLLGRRTYEDILGYWNIQGSPFKDAAQQRRQVRRLADTTRAASLAQLDAPARRRRGRGDAAQAASRQGPPRDGKRRADPDADAPRPDRRVPPHDPPARARHRPTALRRWGHAGSSAPRRQRGHHDRCADRHLPSGRPIPKAGRKAGNVIHDVDEPSGRLLSLRDTAQPQRRPPLHHGDRIRGQGAAYRDPCRAASVPCLHAA